MTGQVRTHDEDGGFYPCALCGNDAAGPCAKCKRPTCGDCCVLVDGAAGRWAVCTRCERRHGRSARRAWLSLGLWLSLPLAFLSVLLFLLHWLFG